MYAFLVPHLVHIIVLLCSKNQSACLSNRLLQCDNCMCNMYDLSSVQLSATHASCIIVWCQIACNNSMLFIHNTLCNNCLLFTLHSHILSVQCMCVYAHSTIYTCTCKQQCAAMCDSICWVHACANWMCCACVTPMSTFYMLETLLCACHSNLGQQFENLQSTSAWCTEHQSCG